MAAGPPLFVADYQTVFNTTTTPKTAGPTNLAGDLIVVCAVTEDAANTLSTPTGGSGLSWTLHQSITVAAYCAVYVWSSPVPTDQNPTISVSKSADAGGWWGFDVYRFAGTQGAGASAKTNVSSGAPSLAVTTNRDNSALLSIHGDWNAVDASTRTWRTVNSITPTAGNGLERLYFRDGSHYGVHMSYYNDTGAAGSKTIGQSAPSGQKYAIIGLEVYGWAKPPVLVSAYAVQRAGSW